MEICTLDKENNPIRMKYNRNDDILYGMISVMLYSI